MVLTRPGLEPQSVGKALNGIVGVMLGLYLINVAIKGNSKALMAMLKDEGGYLQLLVAMYALYLLHEYGPTSKVTDALIIAAITAVLVKAATNVNTGSILTSFANGQANMLDTVKALFGK